MAKMSSADLIILGLILDKPMSAYEIAQIIESQIIGMLVKISSPTVYKNIKRLHKENCLSMETVQEGEMPPKKVYTVTQQGREHFQELMLHYSKNFDVPAFEYNAFIINIDKVDKETGLQLLENLRQHFVYAEKMIRQHERDVENAGNVFFAGRAIIKQYRMHMETYVRWIEETIAAYTEENVLEGYLKSNQFGGEELVQHHRAEQQ